VSSLIGTGMPEFFRVVGEKKDEYDREYKPELERRIRERVEEGKTAGLDKLMKDMEVGSTSRQHGTDLLILADENLYI
jgi:GPN-loop GTPase